MTTLVEESNRPIEDGAHEISVLTKEGDVRIIWDPDNEAEVANAKEQFESWTKKGYRAYRVTRGGKQGEQIREFDPEADKIIFAPAMAGG